MMREGGDVQDGPSGCGTLFVGTKLKVPSYTKLQLSLQCQQNVAHGQLDHHVKGR